MSTRLARSLVRSAFLLVALLMATNVACAQLASSFYNVTAIETKILPNVVRIVVRTDGQLRYGGDMNEWINWDPWSPKPITSFRIRLLGARSKLPSYVNIGAYPIEAAELTPGREDMNSPYFYDWNGYGSDPTVDIRFHFFVPVKVRQFSPGDDGGINFGRVLEPLDFSVQIGQDRQSIVINIFPDRADSGGAERLRRVPETEQKSRFTIEPLDASTRFRIEAVHAPLSELLQQAARMMKREFALTPSVAETRISLFLPSATVEEFEQALQMRGDIWSRAENGVTIFDVAANAPTQRIPLRYITPENARLMLPDFLLPGLRADRENSALLTTQTPVIVERLRRDLEELDVPRAQVRVEASVWEFASTQEAIVALEAARVTPNASWSFDARGALSLAIGAQASTQFQVRANLLESRGRAKLLAKPNITIASGENGTLFLGQSRFVQVLQNSGNGNEVRALRLQIGYTLNVKPRVGVGDAILLDVSPRVSTIDDIETSTRLPTLGIRETSATLRLAPGDNILLGGLDSDLQFETRGETPLSRLAKPLAPRAKSGESRALIVLVSARKV